MFSTRVEGAGIICFLASFGKDCSEVAPTMPRSNCTFASAVNASQSVSMRLMPLGLIYRSALYALLARGRSLFSTSPT